MTTRTRRVGAVLALVALVASFLILRPGEASADSTVKPVGLSIGGNVNGSWHGGQHSYSAGLIGVDTDGNGSVDAYMYCIDLGHSLANGTQYIESTWDSSNVPNLGKVLWILKNYPASGTTTQHEAMAVQAAIWHFTDGFNLSQDNNPADVVATYNYILANAQNQSEPSPTLSITPTPQQDEAGSGLVYTVNTNAAGPVALSLTGGPADAKIYPVAMDGSCATNQSPITSITPGGKVCVWSNSPGASATLHGEVTAAGATGHVYVNKADPHGKQKLIFASNDTVKATADAQGSWTNHATIQVQPSCATVDITSSKDISNVIWQLQDGTAGKADGLSGKTYQLPNDPANPVVAVWVKSGNNHDANDPQPPAPYNTPGAGKYFQVAAPTGCVPVPEVTTSVACTENDGTVTVNLDNKGYGQVTFVVTNPIDANDTVTKVVGPGGHDTVVFSGIPDGTYTVPVTANDKAMDQQVTVDCDSPGTGVVTSSTTCTDNDGTVTVKVDNTGTPGKAKSIHVVITDRDGSTVKWEGDIPAGQSHTETFTGVPDGEWTYPVTVDGTSDDQTVTVDCDEPGIGEVTSSTVCTDNDGTVTVKVENIGTPGANKAIDVVIYDKDGSTVAWSGSLAPGENHVQEFAGVPDGEHTYPVTVDGEHDDQKVTVDCDAPGIPVAESSVACTETHDGTITVTIRNDGEAGKAKPVAFQVKDPQTGTVVFDGTLVAGQSKSIQFPGLDDGTYTVPVKADDGTTVKDLSQTLKVECDVPGSPKVTSSTECSANDGTIVVKLENTGTPGEAKPIAFVVKDPQSGETVYDGTVAAGQSKTVTFPGLPDGTYTVPVTADGEPMDQVLTVHCDEPGVGQVTTTTTCTDNDGTVTVKVENTGTPGKNEAIHVVIKDRDGSTVKWEGDIAAGQSHTETFTGVPDGEWTYPVAVDGTSDDQKVTVDCDGPGTGQVTSSTACTDNDGTVTVKVDNTGTPGKAKAIHVVIKDRDGTTVKWEGDIAPGDSHTETFTGVPDGEWTYPVTVDGEHDDQKVTVDCDGPGVPVVSNTVACSDNDGTVGVTVKNDGVPGKAESIHVVIKDRDGTTVVWEGDVAAGDSHTETFTGVPDGTWTYPVTTDGESHDQTVTVDCDGPGTPVVDSSVACTTDGGVITVTLENTGEPGKAKAVTFEVTNPTDSEDVVTKTVAAGETEKVTFSGVPDGTYTVPVTDGKTSFDQTVEVKCQIPVVEGMTLACDPNGQGVVVGLSNEGETPTTFTVTKDGEEVDEVTVDGNGTADVLVPMVEDETATIEVLDGDEVVATQTLTLDCAEPVTPTTQPVTPTTQPGAQVLGTVQTATPVSPKGTLPFTGSDVVDFLLVGLGLALFGGGLVILTKRRRA